MHNGIASGPVKKRQKTGGNNDQISAPLVRQSKIFAPFRVSFRRTMKALA
jgi:U3 small nucleolar RNA-associated protein 21